MKTKDHVIKRGMVKLFRQYLNETCSGGQNHNNGAFRQISRPYGDYLYAQDRERFQVELLEWAKAQSVTPVTHQHEETQ